MSSPIFSLRSPCRSSIFLLTLARRRSSWAFSCALILAISTPLLLVPVSKAFLNSKVKNLFVDYQSWPLCPSKHFRQSRGLSTHPGASFKQTNTKGSSWRSHISTFSMISSSVLLRLRHWNIVIIYWAAPVQILFEGRKWTEPNFPPCFINIFARIISDETIFFILNPLFSVLKSQFYYLFSIRKWEKLVQHASQPGS